MLKYYFVRDAKMSLVSHLLKRYVVSRWCSVPWGQVALSRNRHTKPVWVDPETGASPIDFNVSHQAGIVALAAAVHGRGLGGVVDIGTDVVCTSERRDRDHKMVREDGWAAFVDVHAEVFAPAEVEFLKGLIPPSSESEAAMDFRLRWFYTLWCLREAYVKMTGEALLAPWIRQLEFSGFRPPRQAASFEESLYQEDTDGTVGSIRLAGQTVDDANMSLRSLGPDYLTCTAVRTAINKEDGLAIRLGPFQLISLEEIIKFAADHR